MARSQLLDLLYGYEDPVDENGNPLPLGKRFYSRTFSGTAAGNSKKRASSRIVETLSLLPKLLTYTKAKIYGLAALTFGFLVLAVNFLGFYIGFIDGISIATLVMGSVFCAIGIPLLFADKPMLIMLQDAPLFDFIFFEFFCIQRIHRKEGEHSLHPSAALAAGILGAALSCFVPAEWISAVIGAVLFVCTAFGSPEFSYIVALLMLPYLGVFPAAHSIFSAIVLLTAVSFARKTYQGKRVFSFERYDLIILVMMLCILVNGVFIKGMESFTASAMLVVMSLGYFMTSNIITNRRLADRAMNAVVVSSIPVSAVAVVSYISDSVSAGGLIYPAESSVFGSTSIFATFLIVAVCFSMAHSVQTHAVYKKIIYAITCVFSLAALFLTGEVFAIGALILGALSYLVFRLKKALSSIMITILFILPVGVYFLPESFIDPIFNFIPSMQGYEETVELIASSFKVLAKSFFFGIGIGSDSFAAEMLEEGIIADNSGILYLELALEAGVLSLIAFGFLIITRIKHRMVYSQYIKGSVLRKSQPVVSAAIFSLLFYGFFSYIWCDTSMFYLFFVVFGIESAMLRVSRRDSDERILYFVDARSVDSASIDVALAE